MTGGECDNVGMLPGADDAASKSAVSETAERLKDFIVSRRLAEGDRLPSERALAQELNVSRNTVREALGILGRIRVLDIRPGAGAFVTDFAPATLLDTVSFMIDFSPRATLLDLVTLRRVIEAETAALAAARMTPGDLARLEECFARMAEVPADEVDATVALDMEFHGIINDASGNRALSTLAATLNGTTFRLRALGGLYHSVAPSSGARAEHHAIFAAIRERNATRASACAAAHVAAVEQLLHDTETAATA
ncbi:MAG TPA: FCD domain-containing protein [Trebonia sp.]|nr:FCD domain-containing protein [Trebonia sp.]